MPAAKKATSAATDEKTTIKPVLTADEAAPLPSEPPRERVPAKPEQLAVAEGDDPWTAEEVAEVHAELVDDLERFRTLVEKAEADLLKLLADGNDGAGRDPADVGANNFERDQEILITAKNREGFEQSERALDRLESGEYGTCESCGKPIGKGRLMAFPRATLCVACKQREERR